MKSNACNTHHSQLATRCGQSLIEVLIALLVGAIMIGAGATLIAPVLKSNTQTLRAQVGGSLAKELMQNVSVWADSDWNGVLALATTSANRYYLTTSTSPFSHATGTETLQVGTTTYTRYFYLDEVERDAGDVIVVDGTGTNDPSTKKVTVVYRWPQSTTNTMAMYLTRSRTGYVVSQTDWFGGPGLDTPVTSTGSRFSTSTSIYYATTTGSIQIQFQ
ncbi:MAG: prepilin-type N-terminal cleavage/methylation domain-containing protein [Candidatus Liptonbacteria bacterium]|nr:prepilin-type N-terminal cleavage/methylation domain-containing protein [Candidatus Liptonbacteria bacterium]